MFSTTEKEIFILGLISSILWFGKFIPFYVAITVFLLIFVYLYLKQRPIHHYLIVCFFSIFARNNEHAPNYDYILTGILFFIVLLKGFREKKITIGKLLLILILNTIYSIISLSYLPGNQLLRGLMGIGSFLQGYLAYFIVTNSGYKFTKDSIIVLSKITSLFLFFISIQIINQFLIYDFESIEKLKDIVNLGWGYGNIIAPFYIMFLPLALYKYTIKDKYYLQYFFLDMINVGGIFLTLSRGGYLGLFVALIIFLIYNIRNFKMFYRYGSIAIFVLVLGYLIPFINRIINTLFGKLSERNFFDDNARYPMWDTAINAFFERPIFGYGINSTNFLLLRDIGRNSFFFHNFILNIAATLGIVGLIILFILLLRITITLFKPKSIFITTIAAGILGSLVQQFVDIMFDYLMFGLAFYVLIGIAELYRNQTEDNFKLKELPLIKRKIENINN